MSYYSRINHAFDGVPHLPLSESTNYVLFSDCHRGNGTSNDNLLKNQNLYFAALKKYYKSGFTYIELGDGDELWENRKMEQIIEIHSNIFWQLSLFYQEKRLYMLYGNHDMVKKSSTYRERTCSNRYCSHTGSILPLFPQMPFYSGLILEDKKTGKPIFLTHGHQADMMNSTFWKINRFLVRYLWKPLEHIGFLDPTSAAKNYSIQKKTESRLNRWADERGHILVTGHTHRSILGSKDSLYFNTGSCVHPRCITCIELSNRRFTLVKWCTKTRSDATLYIAREVLAGPISIDSIY